MMYVVACFLLWTAYYILTRWVVSLTPQSVWDIEESTRAVLKDANYPRGE